MMDACKVMGAYPRQVLGLHACALGKHTGQPKQHMQGLALAHSALKAAAAASTSPAHTVQTDTRQS